MPKYIQHSRTEHCRRSCVKQAQLKINSIALANFYSPPKTSGLHEMKHYNALTTLSTCIYSSYFY